MSGYAARYRSTERYRLGWDSSATWEPAWEYCEVCGRETPHKRFHNNSIVDAWCIYSDLVHGDYEWSDYSCSWVKKRERVQPVKGSTPMYLREMKRFGLDPDNAEHVREYAGAIAREYEASIAAGVYHGSRFMELYQETQSITAPGKADNDINETANG